MHVNTSIRKCCVYFSFQSRGIKIWSELVTTNCASKRSRVIETNVLMAFLHKHVRHVTFFLIILFYPYLGSLLQSNSITNKGVRIEPSDGNLLAPSINFNKMFGLIYQKSIFYSNVQIGLCEHPRSIWETSGETNWEE